MAQGLRVWDGFAALKLDTSSKTGRVIGLVTIGSGGSGYIDVSKAGGELLFAVLTLTNGDQKTGDCYVGNTDGSGNPAGSRIWYSCSAGTGGYLVYGVY